MKRSILFPALLLLACLVWGQTAAAQPEPVEGVVDQATDKVAEADPADPMTQTPPTLTVRDLLVIRADRFGETANDPADVTSTLFNGVPRRGRPISSNNEPMPLGLITFQGEAEEPLRVRMDLPNDGSVFHAHWPKDAHKGINLIDWFQVLKADDRLRAVDMPAGHWLTPLRDSDDRLWLSTREGMLRERFLLYDASMPFKSPYSLVAEDEQYSLQRPSGVPPPRLTMLVHKAGAGWSADTLQGDWQDGATIGDKPTSAPTVPRLPRALSPLRDELARRGYNSAEIGLALGMVRSAGLDNSLISLVYIMPESEVDKHLWLRFKPEPDRVIRTVLVVVTNVDPDLGSRIETLIADLGSDSWVTRDLAQRALTNMGQAAIAQVQAQRNHDDPEIAFRARQILDAYDLRAQRGR